jgi:hypothetical protein
MAMTGYYKTMTRPRTNRPFSFLKYDPVGTFQSQDVVYGWPWQSAKNGIGC